MRFGTAPCSGDLVHEPCTACRLEARGIPVAVGQMLANVPDGVTGPIGSVFPSAVRRVLCAGRSDRIRQTWMAQMAQHADRLIAPSRWLKDMLLRNGVPETQVVVCPQGVDLVRFHPATLSAPQRSLRVGFVGRYDPVKGLHVLIDAVLAIPDEVPIETHVWGIARAQKERSYRVAMTERAHGSPRIVFHDEASSPNEIYSSIDVLAVPSLWLETGPLVVLEAHAAAVPVVGSNLGGIAERVVAGANGLLVSPGDVDELSRVLTGLAIDRTRLERLKPAPPRTMTDVAVETWRMYQTLARANAA
jgi:glycosyltransferase involved in cell wall biosynthesis